jgi:hypothetical protein
MLVARVLEGDLVAILLVYFLAQAKGMSPLQGRHLSDAYALKPEAGEANSTCVPGQ